jgi:hypothetical protein
VHQRHFEAEHFTLGKFRRQLAIIHRTVRCFKKRRPPELASLGNSERLLRYNSPDMSGVHQTVRCNCGATATSRQRSPAGAFNARSRQARASRCTGRSTVHVRCTPDIQEGPEVRSSNGQNPNVRVTWLAHRTVRCAPDCPVHHRTDSLHPNG